MPQVTETFVRQRFYRTFMGMSAPRREGILEGLNAAHVLALETDKPVQLPLLDEGGMGDGISAGPGPEFGGLSEAGPEQGRASLGRLVPGSRSSA